MATGFQGFQGREQRLGLLEIGGVKALGKPVVDLSQHLAQKPHNLGGMRATAHARVMLPVEGGLGMVLPAVVKLRAVRHVAIGLGKRATIGSSSPEGVVGLEQEHGTTIVLGHGEELPTQLPGQLVLGTAIVA